MDPKQQKEGPITKTVKDIFWRNNFHDTVNVDLLIRDLGKLLNPEHGEPDWDDIEEARKVIRSNDPK